MSPSVPDAAAGRLPEGPCLDANDVAALSDPSLPGAERDALVAHLGRCAACREWVGATAAADDAGDVPAKAVARLERPTGSIQASIRRTRWVPFAIAAAALLSIGVGLGRSPRVEATSSPAAEAARVGSAYLDLATLAARDRGPERGGVAILAPRGTVATDRPDLAWTPVPGATSTRVTVRDAQGALRLDAISTSSSLAWPGDRPALAPGAAYVVRVVVSTAAGDAAGSEAFRVPSVEEADRFARAIARITSEGRPAWKALLCAHEAAAAGRWAQADAFLSRAAAAGAPAAEVAALRGLVDHRLGRGGP